MEKCKNNCLAINVLLLITATFFSIAVDAQAPVISSFSPASATMGSTVTISGSNFSPVGANNIVYFGGVQARVTVATANTLTVTVPSGATMQPITVTTNNLTAFSAKPFVTTFAGGSASLFSGSFTPLPNLTTGLNPYGICAADLDGDSKPDLVTANNANSPTPSTISVLRNTGGAGSVSFVAQITFPAPSGSYPYNMTIADIDGDGKLDLVFPSVLSNTVSVYRNTSIPGAISFAARSDFSTGTNPYSVAIADLDGDGKPDMVVANFLSNTISLFKNTSSPGVISFNAKMDLGTSLGPHTVAIADLDGDGKPDIAVTNTLSSTISLFRNQNSVGSFVFAAKSDIPTGSNEPFGLAIADLDGDGKPDLLMTNDNFNAVNEAGLAFSIFRNNSSVGAFSFAAPASFGTGNAFNPSISDLNGDGKPDIVIPSDNTSLLLYANSSVPGSISLNSPVSYADASPYAAAICAFDGDGVPELAVANFNANTISLFKNMTTAVGISRFYPVVAVPGGSDTIIGANFTGATAVSFGAQAATSFIVVSDTAIIAFVGTGATGSVAVTTPRGTATLDGFTLGGTPTLSSFSPTAAASGQTITITGTNFSGASAVQIGGQPASLFTVNSPTTITAIVNNGAAGQDIAVTTPGGTADISGFFYVGPTISSFSPTAGTAGTVVTITGNNFDDIAAVTFGGVPASSFTVISASSIQAVIGIGTSGNIIVTNTSGVATDSGFIYSGPSISSLVPAFGGPGTMVTIKGINLKNASAVNLGGNAAASFTVVDSATIQAVIATGSTGTVDVVTPNGTATFPGFTFTTYPAIATFSPAAGNVGASVTINGANFDPDPAANSVFFGAVKAAVSSATYNSIVTTIPAGATYERVTLLTGGQVAAARNPVVVTFNGAGPAFTANSFNGPLRFTVDNTPADVVVCDFDGDGKPDVATGCFGTVAIRRNTSTDGFVSFAPKLDITGVNNYEYMAIGDLDGDGKPDLVVADYSTAGATVSIYRNISTPGIIAFAPKVSLALPYAESVHLVDMDGDGKLDLIELDGFPGNWVNILRNTSSGGNISFGQPLTFQPTIGGVASQVGIADMDGDGRPDLVLAGNFGLATMINTSVPGAISIQQPGVEFASGGGSLVLADMDGDGKPDVVTTYGSGANDGQSGILIYPNTTTEGNISFGGAITVPTLLNAGTWAVVVNDMDGDGKPDMVTTNLSNNSVSIFKSNCSPGNFSFAAEVEYQTDRAPWMSVTGDLNGDSKPEIIVSTQNPDSASNTISVYVNRTGLSSLTPSIQAEGSSVICQGDTVTLSSSSATNNQWYVNGQAISGATNPALSVMAAGVYTVTTAFPGSMSDPSAGDTIVVTPAPPQPTITLNPAEGLISSADSGNQWYIDTSTAISGAVSQVYQPSDSGYYAVKVTENGCTSPFSDTIFYHLPVPPDTTSVPAGHAIAAPNPVITNLVQIIYNFPGINGLSADLYDFNGKFILSQPNLQSGNYLNLSAIVKGIYVLKLRNATGKTYATISIVRL